MPRVLKVVPGYKLYKVTRRAPGRPMLFVASLCVAAVGPHNGLLARYSDARRPSLWTNNGKLVGTVRYCDAVAFGLLPPIDL